MSVPALQVSDFRILDLTVYISQILFNTFKASYNPNFNESVYHSPPFIPDEVYRIFEQDFRGEDVVNSTSDKINPHVMS